MATHSEQPLARLHALCTLDGLEALTVETLKLALTDKHAGVRRHAVRLTSGTDLGISVLQPLVKDSDANVRLNWHAR